jgi:hypothetical protein
VNEASVVNGAGAAFSVTQGYTTMTLADWLLTDGGIRFSSNQTVDAGLGGFAPPSDDLVFDGGQALVAANHTGRFSLNVPEPSTLGIFGMSLLAFAVLGRRRLK